MSRERPHAILNREDAVKNVTAHFADQIALLSDLANYGSNLFIRCFNSSNKDLAAVLSCGVLLKQVTAMIDATCTLVSAGDVLAAHLPTRAAFEASIYLDWILFSNQEEKATAYLVSNYRDERTWAKRVIKGTEEEEIFSSIAKTVGLDIHARRPTLAADAEKHLDEVDRILKQDGFAEMDKRFDDARGRRKHDVEWYVVCGAKSIRNVAEQVGRLAEYQFFYSRGSQITHSATYKDHVQFEKRVAHFKQIRTLEGIDTLLNFVVSTAIRTFQSALSFYRPKELPSFWKKYAEDWRGPFLSVKKVEYKSGAKIRDSRNG